MSIDSSEMKAIALAVRIVGTRLGMALWGCVDVELNQL